MRKNTSKVTEYEFDINDIETYLKTRCAIGPGQTNYNIRYYPSNFGDDAGNLPIAIVTVTE